MEKMKWAAVVLILLGSSALGIAYLASGIPLVDQPDEPAEVPIPPIQADVTTLGDQAEPDATKDRTRVVESYLEPIDITGRATGPDGQPIAGATVYVIDWWDRRPGARPGQSRLVMTATTGPDGRFAARGVRLGATPQSGNQGPEVGEFQVAGTAPGFGLTWHEDIRVHPSERRPSKVPKLIARGPEDSYAGEPIQADLAFDHPATVRGRIVNDLGRPLAGVKVQVGVCDDLRQLDGRKIWQCHRVTPAGTSPQNLQSFGHIDALPEALLSTRTQPDGTYRIDGLPREAQSSIA